MLINRRSAILMGGALALGCRAASADSDLSHGPFGLVYGSSTDDVTRGGVHLDPFEKKDWGESFTATGLARVLSDMDEPILSFGFKNRLWRIAAPGRTFASDPYGGAVLTRYEELKASLTQRYGRGAETDMRDHEVFKEANEYVMSLKQGRASRYTMFETREARVELSIRALDSDSAYYLIIYASVAEQRAFDLAKKDHENSAL